MSELNKVIIVPKSSSGHLANLNRFNSIALLVSMLTEGNMAGR
jgi:hypothetical protein